MSVGTRRRWEWAPVGLAIALALTACAEGLPRSGGGEAPDPPPSVTLRFSDQTTDLVPWSYCYGDGCADGIPPEEPFDVGSPEEVVVEYPLPGWSFTAFFTASGDECAREQRVPLAAAGEGRFVLRPAGHAGSYDVRLFGRGDGDLAVTFRWTTPTDGPLPTPSVRLALLADRDGAVDSYGIELELTNLAETPEEATATITVRAEGGEELTFEASRAKGRCRPEGTVYWDGPDAKGLAAATLGEAPFTYEVELVLDGIRYVATADWPADTIAGNEPSVALDVDPKLPALT
jgi:hypothetical protein